VGRQLHARGRLDPGADRRDRRSATRRLRRRRAGREADRHEPARGCGAGLGTLLGIPFGLPGVPIGPLAGAVLGELSVHRQWGRTAGVGVAAWIGFLIGTVVKVGLAFAIIAIFIAALFWR